jgi:hypothetical protein
MCRCAAIGVGLRDAAGPDKRPAGLPTPRRMPSCPTLSVKML